MFGYCGTILEINLSDRVVNKKQLSEEMAKNYIGGAGLGAALYVEATRGMKIADIKPLSSNNPLIFATGPLTGTPIPAASRFSACTRSPLSNGWGESNAGGFFAMEMKKAGIDAIVIKGASDTPVHINIQDGNVEILDATELWGQLDTYETCEKLKDFGRVLAIGKAGENQINVAAIAAGTHNFFGRAGLGAVMGSKKVKAITVKGTKNLVVLADVQKVKEVREKFLVCQKAHPFTGEALPNVGSISGVEAGKDVGDLPTKNWTEGKFDGANLIGCGYMSEHYAAGSATCFSCPVACKRTIQVDDRGYKVPKSAGPEYETAAAFGSMCLNDNQASILKGNELCNRYGMDTMSTGAMIAVAMESYEKGYITKEDAGMEINWGDDKVIIKLIEEIAEGTGLGARLGRGMVQFLSELPESAQEMSSAVKGVPSAFHDPRLLWGLALDYATGSIGGSHVVSAVMFTELGFTAKAPEIFGREDFIPPSVEGKAQLVKAGQDYGAAIFTAASICQFGGMPYAYKDVIDAINAVTGFNYDLKELLLTGERIWGLKRCLNNIWGFGKDDDKLGKRQMTPVVNGPMEGVVPDMDTMLKEYYKIRGLDDEGRLIDEVLNRLNLPNEVVSQLK